ncbi:MULTISPECIES: neutral/alkaline non-lysosomal ceramidase N-terminal domain-containing protein [unclassified Arthrobacter]|uniref:neutral/alkaline non-lysosomal ceramidase N-terminal domain-containing protein n=1 Tax=unclassified Arthrobacter TaxID=235627 RepID=UPI002550A5F6|nr:MULTISPECIES: neutral/alkaline non-lysosomal ceramidase N-terminal domain-containing protein [unclassified Arthrobacter]
MAFRVGTASADITPSLSTNPYMAGYGTTDGGRVATSSSPYEPLYARAILIWEDTSPQIIISVDVLAIPRAMHQRIRSRIVDLADWASSDIILQATHTHNGPALIDTLQPYMAYGISDLGLIRSYSADLEDTIVNLAQDALNANEVAVTFDYKVSSQNIAANRAGLPYTETAVPILVARGTNGKPVAVIFSYGCHPISAGLRTLFDGDFAAGACNYIENNNPNCFAMFLQGPAGDQDPGGVRSWALRDQHADALGATVSTNMQTAGRALTGPISTQYKEVQLPLDITATPANLAAVRADYVARLPNPDGQPQWYQRHAQVMIARIDSNSYSTSVPSPFQVWKFNGSPQLKIALVGGELVSGYGAYFRNQNGGSNGIIIGGYANESCCYIPSNEFFPPNMPLGSYEGGWEPDYPGIAGGAMTVYGHLGHFKAGANGVETTLINAMNAMLA